MKCLLWPLLIKKYWKLRNPRLISLISDNHLCPLLLDNECPFWVLARHVYCVEFLLHPEPVLEYPLQRVNRGNVCGKLIFRSLINSQSNVSYTLGSVHWHQQLLFGSGLHNWAFLLRWTLVCHFCHHKFCYATSFYNIPPQRAGWQRRRICHGHNSSQQSKPEKLWGHGLE